MLDVSKSISSGDVFGGLTFVRNRKIRYWYWKSIEKKYVAESNINKLSVGNRL